MVPIEIMAVESSLLKLEEGCRMERRVLATDDEDMVDTSNRKTILKYLLVRAINS